MTATEPPSGRRAALHLGSGTVADPVAQPAARRARDEDGRARVRLTAPDGQRRATLWLDDGNGPQIFAPGESFATVWGIAAE